MDYLFAFLSGAAVSQALTIWKRRKEERKKAYFAQIARAEQAHWEAVLKKYGQQRDTDTRNT